MTPDAHAADWSFFILFAIVLLFHVTNLLFFDIFKILVLSFLFFILALLFFFFNWFLKSHVFHLTPGYLFSVSILILLIHRHKRAVLCPVLIFPPIKPKFDVVRHRKRAHSMHFVKLSCIDTQFEVSAAEVVLLVVDLFRLLFPNL